MKSSSPIPSAIERIASYSMEDLQDLSQDTLLELVGEVLQIKKYHRDEKQIKVIELALQEIQFFKKMRAEHGEDLFKECLGRLVSQKIRKDTIVFNIGDVGNAFYVLIRGQVGIYLPKPKTDEQKPSKPDEQSPKSAKKLKRNTIQSQSLHAQLQEHMLEVAVLNKGSHFGELALLDDALRTATVICKENCEFAVLHRKDFKEILAKHSLWQIKKDVLFFSSLPLFEKSASRAISTLIYHFKLQKYKRQSVLYKEGEEPTHFYVIKKGEVKLSKRVSIKPPADPRDFENKNQLLMPTTRILEFAILGPKEIFGEEELYYNKKREVTAVVESTEAEIFVMDKNDFKKRLISDAAFVAYFNSYCKDKRNERELRLQFAIDMIIQKQEPVNVVDRKSRISPRTKKPMSSNPMKGVTNQLARLGASIMKPQMNVDLNAIDYGSARNKDKAVDNGTTNRQYFQPKNPKDHSFFMTNFGFDKEAVDLTHESPSAIESVRINGRSGSMPHSQPVTIDGTRKDVINERVLFERKIFENNKTKILPRVTPRINNGNYLLGNLNESSPNPQSYRRIRDNSPIKSEMLKEEDITSLFISARQKILDEKLTGHPDELLISMDFLLDPSPRTQRKVPSPDTSDKRQSLAARIKNLPVFRTIQPQQLHKAPKIKNTHTQTRKMQDLIKDVCNGQVKILRHMVPEKSQLRDSSFELTFNNVNQSSQAILLNEQAFKTSATVTQRFPNSARSDAVTRSLRNSVMESDNGVQLISASKYCSRNNSVIDSSRGMIIKSYRGKSANDSL